MLCETCIGVLQHRCHFIGIVSSQPGEVRAHYVNCGHHLTCESLVAAAANGCPICQPTWESLSAPQQDSLRALKSSDNADAINTSPPFGFITFAQLSSDEFSEDLSFRITYDSNWLPELQTIDGFFLLEKTHDFSHLHDTSYASHQTTSACVQNAPAECSFTTGDTSSTASLQMAGMWLKDCVQSHQQCNTYQRNSPWYPTRLLHVVESYGNEDYISLTSTTEKSPDGPYATLSHRWGNYKPLQLTWSMAFNPNHRFPMVDMPKTFQETIQVLRILGIRYLWIDSLCIIQDGDDLRDWYHEAGLMDKVYLHSYLNIFAADAADSTKGLFRHHLPLRVGRQHVTVNTKDIEPGSDVTDCLLMDRYLWSRTLEKSPLNNRGWVFQERYLAPRVLYFCRDQIFWECKELIACETIPEGFPDDSLIAIKSWEKKHQSVPRAQLRDAWRLVWTYGMVSAYSKMDLTVPSDKLIALSGIAKFFMTQLSDEYVAGMWRNRLEESLLWYVPPTSLQPRPLVYRAPSWSWASVDGAIQQCSPPYDEGRIQVLDVVLSYATGDTTGAVIDGWLDLRGVLKPLELCESKESDIMPRMVLNNTIASPQHDTIAKNVCMMTGIHLDYLPDRHYLRNDDNVQGRLFYMPCRSQGSYDTVCLLLKLVDEGKTLFERFGISLTSEPAEVEQLLAGLDDDTKARLPCLHYENGLHTIRVI